MNSDQSKRSCRWIWIDPPILLCTAFLSCVSVFFSLFDGTGRLQHGCARTWARFILWISKATVQVEGLENVPRDRPCIVATNHQSFFDIWTLLAYLPIQFRFAAKDALFRIPFLGWHLRRSGNIPIHRRNPRKALRSLRDAARRIDAGVSVLIFPEGGRSSDGVIQPFKKGVFLLAAFSNAPIIPITIIGSRFLLPKTSYKIQPGTIRVFISPALETTGYNSGNIDELMERVRSEIVAHYRETI